MAIAPAMTETKTAAWCATLAKGLRKGEVACFYLERHQGRGWDACVYSTGTPLRLPLNRSWVTNRAHVMLFAVDPDTHKMYRAAAGHFDMLRGYSTRRVVVALAAFDDEADEKDADISRTLVLEDVCFQGNQQGQAFRDFRDKGTPPCHLLDDRDRATLRAYAAAQHRYWTNHPPLAPLLMPWRQDCIRYPGLKEPLPAPMLVQTYGLTCCDPVDPILARELLQRLANAARARLRLDALPRASWTDAHWQELLAEMCLLPAVSSTYALDRQGDQWRWPSLTPDTNRVLYDCEDGTAWTLRVFFILKRTPLVKSEHPLLHRLQEWAQRYRAFLALGVLRMSRLSNTYHAYPLLLDARAVDYWAGHRDDPPAKPFASMILESTNWTTSCPNFRPPQAVARYEHQPLPHIRRFPAVQRKIPMKLVEENDIYVVTHALLTPQFIEKGVPDVALWDVKEKHSAVATRHLLAYDFGRVKWDVPCHTLKPADVQRALDRMRQILPVPVLPRVEHTASFLSSAPAPREAFVYWVRDADWSETRVNVFEKLQAEGRYRYTARPWNLWGKQIIHEVRVCPSGFQVAGGFTAFNPDEDDGGSDSDRERDDELDEALRYDDKYE